MSRVAADGSDLVRKYSIASYHVGPSELRDPALDVEPPCRFTRAPVDGEMSSLELSTWPDGESLRPDFYTEESAP